VFSDEYSRRLRALEPLPQTRQHKLGGGIGVEPGQTGELRCRFRLCPINVGGGQQAILAQHRRAHAHARGWRRQRRAGWGAQAMPLGEGWTPHAVQGVHALGAVNAPAARGSARAPPTRSASVHRWPPTARVRRHQGHRRRALTRPSIRLQSPHPHRLVAADAAARAREWEWVYSRPIFSNAP